MEHTPIRSGRSSVLAALVATALVASTVALAAGPASASAPACPTVDAITRVVTPAPVPGVDWNGCTLTGADLHGADLHGADLGGTDLTDADLSTATLTGTNLGGATLTGAALTGVRSGAVAGTPAALPTNWSIVAGHLIGPGADLRGAQLGLTNLSGAHLAGANLGGAVLTGANLTGTDLTTADLTAASLTSATLTGAKLASATLAGVTSGGTTGTPASLPTGWILAKAYLIGPAANLSNAALAGVNLANRDLNHVTLTGANLTGAGLMGTNLDHAAIGNTVFSSAFATGAILTSATGSGGEFSGADLSGADLSGASITGATFRRTDLTHAKLVGTTLTDDVLQQAVLTTATLTGAGLGGADLQGAILTSIVSGNITGTPAALPTGWSLSGGTLLAPGLLRVVSSPSVPTQITVDGAIANTWSLSWVQRTPGPHQVCFTAVAGYTTPPCQTVTVNQYGTTTVTGTFAQRGYLHVVTSPAVASQIKVDGIARDNWGVYTDFPAGSHQICFGAVAGYTAPPCQNINVTAGATATVTGSFAASPAAGLTGVGFLRVTTYPALPSQLTVDGQIADTWGINWLQVAPGSHTVCFSHVEGFTEPGCQTITVTAGQTSTYVGTFTPRVWIKVTTKPALAATIALNGAPADAWGVYTDVAQGSYQVCFGDVASFTPPPCSTHVIDANQIATIEGSYVAY